MRRSPSSWMTYLTTQRSRFRNADRRASDPGFDEVAAELGRTLDVVKVPKREKGEVLAAFAAHKDEVTAGYVAAHKAG